MKPDHPYREFEALRVWKVLNQGIKDLESNGDLEERTAREYIVGYLSKLLVESGLIAESPKPRPARAAKTLHQP